jgi:hypothetical protein
MNETPEDAAVVAQHLHLATGFLASERGWVVERLAALGSRLRSFRDDQIDLPPKAVVLVPTIAAAPMCLPDQVCAMLVAAVGIVYDTDRDRAGVTGRGSRLWWRTGIRR